MTDITNVKQQDAPNHNGPAASRAKAPRHDPHLWTSTLQHQYIREQLRTPSQNIKVAAVPKRHTIFYAIDDRPPLAIMVNKILFWTAFGLGTRFWQLGLEMRPFFNKESLWVWPLFGGIGASFGYWYQGVEDKQQYILMMRKESILAKRARRAEREAVEGAQNES